MVDVIIGTILLAVSLAAVIGLTGQALHSQISGEELQIAAMLADEQLNLVLARGPDDYAKSFNADGPCDPPFGAYRYKVELTGGVGGDPYLVTATITWTSAAGARARTVAVQTYIAPRLGDDPDPDRKPAVPVERVP